MTKRSYVLRSPSYPRYDRDDWLRVGMAIHEAGWGARGFAIWREWSQTAPEKYNDADQTRTWESFDRPSRDGRRVTLATVFHMAIERGWTAGYKSAVQNQQIQLIKRTVTTNAAAPNDRSNWRTPLPVG